MLIILRLASAGRIFFDLKSSKQRGRSAGNPGLVRVVRAARLALSLPVTLLEKMATDSARTNADRELLLAFGSPPREDFFDPKYSKQREKYPSNPDCFG